jgi:outer membrane cobalamin receptor
MKAVFKSALQLMCAALMLCRPTLAQDDKLEPVRTSITVVEKISAEAPANVTDIDQKQLEQIPGVNADDRLRDLPGFSLFRRSSSLVAHPTTQGVSLRGIGSSGASRTLVLWDGVPVNDAFGGWVYWTRFPVDDVARVEISRGASTSLFGNLAMGGVISLWSREPERRRLHASYEGGNRNTHNLSAGWSDLWSHWAVSGEARAFTTDGFFIVPTSVRGPVDQPASVRFATGIARIDWFGRADRVFAKADVLAEERHNGTELQRNSTGLGEVAVHYAHNSGREAFSVLGFYSTEQFHSIFSSINAERTFERLTDRQTVPANGLGADALWQHDGSHWHAMLGADVNRAHGFSTDHLTGGVNVGGGTRLQHGVFGEGNLTAGPATFFGGLRHDFTGQGREFVSPSGGLSVGRGRWRGRGAVYRSFRAPTLNELYRNFRQGNALTEANAGLRPETLFGTEVGLDIINESSRIRVTAYRNSIADLIANVTLNASPTLILRQRQNAGSALNRGAEIEGEQRWRNWRCRAGYLFVDSRLITGLRVPQIPKHQGSAQLVYQRGGTTASAGIRSFSSQFDDDRNQFLLPGFATVQLYVQRRLAKNLAALLEFENLLDRQYLTAFSPTPAIGTPRLWRAGLRWDGSL